MIITLKVQNFSILIFRVSWNSLEMFEHSDYFMNVYRDNYQKRLEFD